MNRELQRERFNRIGLFLTVIRIFEAQAEKGRITLKGYSRVANDREPGISYAHGPAFKFCLTSENHS